DAGDYPKSSAAEGLAAPARSSSGHGERGGGRQRSLPSEAREVGGSVPMTDAASAMEAGVLERALDELAELGTGRDREQIAALRERLAAARLRVLVAGEAKRGKSTLVNALLGRAVLPAGVTPLTAVATTVRYGDDPHAQVRFANGHEEKQPLSALPDLVTERGHPGNQRHIASVTVD